MPLASKVLWCIASAGTSLLVGVYLLEVGGILQIIDGISSGNILRIAIGYFRFNLSFIVQLQATLWLCRAWPELVPWAEKRLLPDSTKRP